MFPAPLKTRSVNSQPVVNAEQQIINYNSTSSANLDNRRRKKIPKQRLQEIFQTRRRVPSRRSSFETTSSKCSTNLPLSRSLGSLEEHIRKERKTQTLPPLPQITQPSSNIKTELFASVLAPSDVQTFQPTDVSTTSPSSFTDKISDGETIIVMVEYDPASGPMLSEDTVREAIYKQLEQQPNLINQTEPIVFQVVGENFQLLQEDVRQIAHSPPPPPIRRQKHLPPLPPIDYQVSRTYLPSFTDQHFIPAESRCLRPPPKPFVNRHKHQDRKLTPSRVRHKSATDLQVPPTDHIVMATQPIPTAVTVQQNFSQKSQVITSSSEVFRPPSVTDIPELSKESLLKMLNQIPDLQGRRFIIEYAPSSAPEGYPFPFNVDSSSNTYPEPVVIDKLPTNVIQQVQNSNNPALQAAFHATIQQEQHLVHTTNVQPPAMIHHVAQPNPQVHQSPRSASSDASDSSTDTTSSSSESEESESDGSQHR